jgi:hypothetical protein
VCEAATGSCAAHVAPCLTSSLRRRTQCNEEIGRLEAEQAKVMRVMIQAKNLEVARLCEATGLPAPDLSILMDDSESAGQVSPRR